MTTCSVTHDFTGIIPAFAIVIPAQAGIHHQCTHSKICCKQIARMDSRLRGNDELVRLPGALEAIAADLDAVSGRIMKLLAEVHS